MNSIIAILLETGYRILLCIGITFVAALVICATLTLVAISPILLFMLLLYILFYPQKLW